MIAWLWRWWTRDPSLDLTLAQYRADRLRKQEARGWHETDRQALGALGRKRWNEVAKAQGQKPGSVREFPKRVNE